MSLPLSEDLLAEAEAFEEQLRLSEAGSLGGAGDNGLFVNPGEREDSEISEVFIAEQLFEAREMHLFDPNTATEDELAGLGISGRISSTIINYRNKGGRFYIADDLKKIYGLSAVEFERISPYIRIINQEEAGKDILFTTEKLQININTADADELMKLKGIGTVLAGRIIKYRTLLGGFYSVEQLKEVYGISDSLFNVIRGPLFTDTAGIKSINVNQATINELSMHPYIGSYYAEGIIRYRDFVKKIDTFDDLLRNNLLPEKTAEKVVNYLNF